MSCVIVENEDSCVRLRLRNTDANLLTIDVVRELAGTLSDAARAGRAVLLCGGDKFFCNGLDLAWALAQPPDDMRAMFLALGDLVLGMLAASVPIVGAIRGHAIGAGKTLFSACDVRYAASGRVLVGPVLSMVGSHVGRAGPSRTAARRCPGVLRVRRCIRAAAQRAGLSTFFSGGVS